MINIITKWPAASQCLKKLNEWQSAVYRDMSTDSLLALNIFLLSRSRLIPGLRAQKVRIIQTLRRKPPPWSDAVYLAFQGKHLGYQ